jgi:hypothetical protein
MSNDSYHEQLRLEQNRFDGLLRELAHSLAPDAAATLIERKAFRFDGVAVELRLDEHRGLVGLYIELCRPQASQELEVCRRVLEAQASQGTPAAWLVGRHPASGILVLIAHTSSETFGPGRASELMRRIESGIRIARGFSNALLEGL